MEYIGRAELIKITMNRFFNSIGKAIEIVYAKQIERRQSLQPAATSW